LNCIIRLALKRLIQSGREKSETKKKRRFRLPYIKYHSEDGVLLMTKNTVATITLFLGLTLFLSIGLNSCLGAAANAEMPEWQVGDWWKFRIEVSGDVSLVGTYTYTVVGDDADVSQNGQEFKCYKLDVSGEGTIYGDIYGTEIGGTWSSTEEHYYMKSDMSWVAFYSTYDETVSALAGSGVTTISLVADETIMSRVITETTYNPPFEANKGFPLTVGESWSAATTETTKTETTISGNTEFATETDAYTKTFSVLGKESITVSAGEFETYVVKRTDPDGVYAETWYSPQVGFDIKEIEYDSTGAATVTMELLEYEHQPTVGDTQFLTTTIFLILAISSIITAIVAIYLLKRKRAEVQSPDDIVNL
jgi:hypothetical protein